MEQRSFEEARRERSHILRGLAAERRSIVGRGELDSWFAGVGPIIRKVAGDSCPPLMERLARRIGWHDVDVVEFFRKGGSEHARARRARHGPPRGQGAPLTGDLAFVCSLPATAHGGSEPLPDPLEGESQPLARGARSQAARRRRAAESADSARVATRRE